MYLTNDINRKSVIGDILIRDRQRHERVSYGGLLDQSFQILQLFVFWDHGIIGIGHTAYPHPVALV